MIIMFCYFLNHIISTDQNSKEKAAENGSPEEDGLSEIRFPAIIAHPVSLRDKSRAALLLYTLAMCK